MKNIGQNKNETKNSYASRIGDAAYRCGDVQTYKEEISIFTKDLLSSVCRIVERFRREQPRYVLMFNRIVSFARNEGDSKRATSQSKTSSDPCFQQKRQRWLVYIRPVPLPPPVKDHYQQNTSCSSWSGRINQIHPTFVTFTKTTNPWKFTTCTKWKINKMKNNHKNKSIRMNFLRQPTFPIEMSLLNYSL